MSLSSFLKIISVLFLFLLPQISFAAEVVVKKDNNGHWNLLVDDKPYFVKGMNYRITKVGQSPDHGTLKDWAYYDYNRNGKADGPFDAWVDQNKNNLQDPWEEPVGDFQLLKDMGVNTIRWYVNDFKNQKPNKELLRALHRDYGIMVAVGDKLGAYTIASGAKWEDGTDYRDIQQQHKMLESVKQMVFDHKDEPYTLMWVLGNENNLRFTNTNAAKFPADYARFLNQAAWIIHAIDGKHPVAFVNGDIKLLSYYARHCPNIDIFAVNAYRGENGFGNLWQKVKAKYDKPVLITEYGGSFAPGINETAQARYHRGCWLDIEANRAGGKGAGNAIGGFAYSWMDEWWKGGDPHRHAKKGAVGKQGVGQVKWDQEYSGMASQGDGKNSPFLRQLRKVYYVYQDLWKE